MDDITITFDPREEALKDGLCLDSRYHEVLSEGDWLKAAKRHTGRDSLLVYRHRVTGQFVLCDIIHPPDVIQELESWPGPPERIGVPMAWVEMRCEPREETYTRIIAKMKEKRYREAAVNAASNEERDSAMKWLKREGYDDTARALIGQPWVGEAEGGEQLERNKEELMRLAKVV
jgi:hypothetical protein